MLDERGERNLIGVHPRLASAVRKGAAKLAFDVTIPDGGGVRSHEQARTNAINGTGILASLHIVQPDGWGHAVDVVPVNSSGAPFWDEDLAVTINDRILEAADDDEFALQEGADWDLDGIRGEKGEWDWHHLQIPRFYKHAAAQAAMARRKKERGAR